MLGMDERQVGGSVAGRPKLGPVRPLPQVLGLVGSRQRIIALLQPRIDHIAGDVSHTGPALSIDIGDRRAGVAGKLDEARRSEARMAYLDDMVELAPIEIAGQQIEEPSEVLRVKAFER